jgi:hypothetical protein
MRLVSFIIASAIAVPWTLLHMAHQSHRGDSIGIGAFLQPFAYSVAFAFFLFLLWFPVLALICSAGSVNRAQLRARASTVRPTLMVLFLLFLVCLWLLITAPVMTAYLPVACALIIFGLFAAILIGVRIARAPLSPPQAQTNHVSNGRYDY